ncbi:MAG: ADOP family duplicated permease [Terriglobia bacterium]
MRWIYKLPLRIRSLFRKAQLDQELSDELRFHLEKQIEENIAQGMSQEAARYAALRELGGTEQIKEECRDMRRMNVVQDLIQDLGYGLRQLRRNPGFTAVAVMTLALGIGANTTIFSVVNAALLHPLPFRDSDRLVTQWGTIPEIGYSGPLTVCDRGYMGWRDQNRVFEQIGAYSGQTSNLTGVGEPVRLMGSQVTASLFPLLGVSPALGRTFSPEEDQPEHSYEALLSDKLWRGRFRSDPAIVGKSIKLDGEFYTVVGVMSAGFGFPNEAEFWTPVPLTHDCSNATLQVVARLKPGVTLDRAQGDVSVINRRLDHKRQPSSNDHITLVPLAQVMGADLRPVLMVLLAAVGLVLLIACANVANLLLARAAARQREIAIRNALGASRRRIIGQMLIESVLLAALGGALGLILAVWGHSLLASSIALLPRSLGSPSVMARIASVGVDRFVLAFTLVVSLLTGIVFGLAPALQASRPDLNETLKEGGRTSSTGLGRGRVRSALVVGEIAVSLILLIGAGLLVRSLVSLSRVNPGFNPESVLTMNVNLPELRYQTKNQMIAFEQQSLQRLEALPGVRSVGWVVGLPLGTGDMRIRGDVTVEGQPTSPRGVLPSKLVVAGDYFRALGIPVIEGRHFNQRDNEDAPRVAIVSDGVARRFWPRQSAIGKRLRPGFSHDSWCTIVGVVGDVKTWGLDEKSSLAIYLPYKQSPRLFLMRDLSLVMRRTANPTSVVTAARHAIEAVDSELPAYDVATMEQLVYRSASEPRFNGLLLGIFAILALALASVGIYGVMSYSVAQETHEIGIRMALGAERQDVLKLVLSQGMILTLMGVATGVAAALGLTRLMASLLYGVKPTDPVTFVAVSLILTAVSLMACYIPARRAMKVDPMEALRHE